MFKTLNADSTLKNLLNFVVELNFNLEDAGILLILFVIFNLGLVFLI